ncbi:hypothetical protein GUITHDRAFT_115839 [Guillardia theta CCMP2712]|uniref:Uncharacterized protein n=2 Tax=Guillardia theta TaxID=55529 RepID=L1IPQ3_GUITC|nr:hypothetical protein GUITHDRAFT_115839 [Guillardia theta CCMP2712]EKX38077.1 hypothetical protein GUITHDRAFT_115839 [Guillardia theta CCMP2712]|eukprot:XP_005825057.1 hypothetical protein GUITHDRAFT_115839 [Guillardia theta CCMP2712]
MAKKWTTRPNRRYGLQVINSSMERTRESGQEDPCVKGTSLSSRADNESNNRLCREDHSENLHPFSKPDKTERDLSEEEIVIQQQEQQLQQDLTALRRRREQLRIEKLKRELQAEAQETISRIEDQLQEKLQSQILELLKCKEEKLESFACYQREVDRQIKQLQTLREQAAVQAEGLELDYIEAVEKLRRQHHQALCAKKEEVQELVKLRLEGETLKPQETSASAETSAVTT